MGQRLASSLEIRRFRWRDLDRFTHLFNDINGVAHTEKAYAVDFMRQCLSHPLCNPEEDCYLAQAQGSLVGFALLSPELPIDRIVATGGVLKSHRNKGIGRMLLRQVTQRATQLGASVLHIQVPEDAADAHHILGSEAFKVVRSYWQMRRKTDEMASIGQPEGYRLRFFRLGRDEEALTQLQNAAFGNNWGFCPNTVEQIAARVRWNRCEPEGIIFIADGDRLAAYNWTLVASSSSGSTGWIAMTGVHPDYRGAGLGRAAVAAGMDYLRAKGVDGIELEVDAENAPARNLYLSLGFKTLRRTVWYEKSLR